MSLSEQEVSPLKNSEKSAKGLAFEVFMLLLFPGIFGVGFSLLALLVILSVKEGRPFWQPPLLLPNQPIVLITILLGTCAFLSFAGILLCLFVRKLQQTGEISRERATTNSLKTWSGSKALFRVFWSLFVVSMLFGLAAYSTAFSVTAEADMTRTGFMQQELTINEGESVIFANPADGVSHQLCLASHEECLNPPPVDVTPVLSSGFRLLPGHSITLVFNSSGDYQIIDALAPQIAMVIHVSSSSDD